jgi:thiamine biosynthesis lipoprotein
MKTSDDLRVALERMRSLSTATGGIFDPGVGPIVEAVRAGRTLAPEAAARFRITEVLTIDGGTVSLAAGARLDAGGIGKGIALDAIDADLRARGATAWFLDFGGSSQLAHGRPEHGAAWNVLIAGEASHEARGYVQLHEGSLSTSRTLPAGDPAGAMIDPRTKAVVPGRRLATVLAADASTAEAWSKAILVLGRDGLSAAHGAGVEALYEDESGVAVTASFPLKPRPASR